MAPTALYSKSNEKVKAFLVPRIKWIPNAYYSLAERLGDFYGYLFIFENALRSKIDTVLSTKYIDYWNTKIRLELKTIYDYSSAEKTKQDGLPMVRQVGILRPIDYITVGQLEQIIEKYQAEFIPAIFPNIHFFKGHMIIIKRVRNAVAHMATSTTKKDIRNAKNEMDILLQHLSTLLCRSYSSLYKLIYSSDQQTKRLREKKRFNCPKSPNSKLVVAYI